MSISLLRHPIQAVAAPYDQEVMVRVRSPYYYDPSHPLDPAVYSTHVDFGDQGKFLFEMSYTLSEAKKVVPKSDKNARMALVQAIAFLQQAHKWSQVSCYVRHGPNDVSISLRWKREGERGSETWEGMFF